MSTVKCPYCGTEHSEGTSFDECPRCHAPHQPSWARYCNACGAELTPTALMPDGCVVATKRCPDCHTDGLPESAAFCSKCGHDFNAKPLSPRMVVTGGRGAYIKVECYERIDLENKVATFRATMYPWITKTFNAELYRILNIDFINISPAFRCRFWYCEFEKIDLSSLDTGYWNSLSYFFNCCDNVKKINLSTFDTSNIEDIYSVFRECHRLEEINISGWDLSKTMPDKCRDFIIDCPSLRRIIMKGCNEYTVDLIENALEIDGVMNVEIVR